jgi:hypothetical protein
LGSLDELGKIGALSFTRVSKARLMKKWRVTAAATDGSSGRLGAEER